MRNCELYRIFASTLLVVFVAYEALSQNSINLDGVWQFAIDRSKNKESCHLLPQIPFSRLITLPGTMDQAGYGDPAPKVDINNQWTFGWKRPVVYEGKAWYQRGCIIPESWKNKRIVLFLEQVRGETMVWLDGKLTSNTNTSFVTPHKHDLGIITPGQHTITILLDNSRTNGIGGSYIRSQMGQGSWQGIVGDIKLQTSDPIWIDNVQFFANNAEEGLVKVKIASVLDETLLIKGTVNILDGEKCLSSQIFDVEINDSCQLQNVPINISGLDLWSEFDPKLYSLVVKIENGRYSVLFSDKIGVRFIDFNDKHQLVINNHPTFLRGTVDYNIFPLTGYPSANVEEWIKRFKIYKEWGMNHVRFHSLTPPLAAFDAADQLGIYLQCEAPKAGYVGKNVADDEFQINEGLRILEEYGNHPSFIMMSMGNELAGESKDIQDIIDRIRIRDPRRIYTSTTGSARLDLIDDYKIYGGIVRGFKGPFTNWDYSKIITDLNIPVLSHEVGQWHVYPDVYSIEKYTGIMKADNLQIIKDDLISKRLVDKTRDFTQLTGKFSAQLYKDEMEAIMRTPNIMGYQILMLNDFPSQGTAHCGMLDVFNQPKGYISAEQFREWVAPVVPLIRIEKRTFSNNEKLVAQVDIANYGAEPLSDAQIEWQLNGIDGTYQEGIITSKFINNDNVYAAGTISCDLSNITTAKKMELLVNIKKTNYKNRWNIWVYPNEQVLLKPQNVNITQTWEATRSLLEKGETVLFLPLNDEMGKWRPGQFKSIFWSPVWLMRGVETMSIMADTNHPIFERFPTEPQTDWQWFTILENSCSIAIDDLPVGFSPIVGQIDGFRKNQRLANMLEAKAGKGRLMIVTIDILKDIENDLARKHLHNAILEYMSSNKFNPKQVLSFDDLDKLFNRQILRYDKIPDEVYRAQLHVMADGTIIKQEAGYSYNIGSKTQVSGVITAWADKRDLWMSVMMPTIEDGTLYLFMRNSNSSEWGQLKTPQEISSVDWVEETLYNYGNKQAAACAIINKEYIGTMNKFDQGKWFAVPISKSQIFENKIDIQISTFNYPNILTEFAFVVNL